MINSKDKQHVLKVVEQLEKQYDVRIIFLCESGSRMWGFPSDDSDLDCRGVFVHQAIEMFKPERPREIIDFKDEKNGKTYVDLQIWSIQKFGRHFKQSNPSIYEWLNSPIIYHVESYFLHIFKPLLEQFDLQHLRRHYVSMAIGNYKKKCCGNEIPAKKYLYVLRALACVACIEEGHFPSVLYTEVMHYLSDEFQAKMKHYVDVKLSTEDKIVSEDSEITLFMDNFMTQHRLRGPKPNILEDVVNDKVVTLALYMYQ